MAGAGFKTFTTGEVLLAADVNTYLMQQTVMVFDDASARATAIPTPSEGMFSYLKDTNLTYRYDGSAWLSDAGTTSPLTTKGDVWGYSTADARIPVGANGTVLTADSAEALGVKWATPSAGGMTLLASGTITGTTTTTSLSQDYKDLVFYLKGLYNSSGLSIDPYFRFNSDTNQVYGRVYSSDAGTGNSANSNAVVTGYDNAANVQTGFIMLRIYDYANTTTFKTYDFVTAATESGGSTFVFRMGRGAWRSTTAVSSMNWHEGNGRTISGGNYEVYGVK